MQLTHLMKLAVHLAVLVGLPLLTACEAAPPPDAAAPEATTDRPVERFEFDSAHQIEQLFDDLGYTPEAWQAGVREVPRIELTNVPARWRDRTADELPVVTKKRVFFRMLGPLVLRSNELIAAERQRLEEVLAALDGQQAMGDENATFLRELAAAYRVGDGGDAVLSDRDLQRELLVRVDTIPPSLVLAQAAEESGWGTSRFAAEGNALFGMWTWGGEGITPLKQRSGLGDYKIAAYETPLASVMAYMANLNNHQAYAELRARRAELRRTGEAVTGWELAGTLTKYSERGQAYVESLRSLMSYNRLQPTDDAHLADGPTIMLIPIGDGVS